MTSPLVEPIAPGAARRGRALFAAWLVTLYGGWVLAWWAFRSLESVAPSLKEPLVATGWWTLAKLVVWLAPMLIFARLIPLPKGALRLGHLRGLGLACLVGAGWIAANACGDAILDRIPAPGFNWAVLSACLVAPFAEELLFRGFAFAWLERLDLGFWQVNASCALLFALLHLPGWALMQGLSLGLLAQLGQTALLGFWFGLFRKGHGSLWGPIALHFANNVWSQGLIIWLLDAPA